LAVWVADSITDCTLPTFARGEIPHFAGERGTFLKTPLRRERPRSR
jgi:agmatinase